MDIRTSFPHISKGEALGVVTEQFANAGNSNVTAGIGLLGAFENSRRAIPLNRGQLAVVFAGACWLPVKTEPRMSVAHELKQMRVALTDSLQQRERERLDIQELMRAIRAGFAGGSNL